MKKLILLALICASFTLQAQTYKTVTMALDTPTNVAILRAGLQSYNLTNRFGLKANLSGATFTGAVNGTSLTLSGAGTVGGNLAVTGTQTFTGNTRINGNLGFSTAPLSGNVVRNLANITGSTTSTVYQNQNTVLSDVTISARGFVSGMGTQAAAFTLPSLIHFFATQNAIGAGSTVTNQYGFWASSTLIGATNNYGFFSDLGSGTGKWNFYSQGTASNYFNGTTLFGTLTDNGVDKVIIAGSASVSTRFGIGTSSTSTFLNLPAGLTTSSSFRMPNGVAPTTPITGDFWNLTTGNRTQTFDGTQTKDVLYDKANAVFADGIVGVALIDGLGNFSKGVQADRTLSNRVVRTTAYTITLADFGANGELILEVNATGGAVAITLPSLILMSGVRVAVHKTDASANAVTVSGAVNINGSASLSLTTQWDSKMITGGSAVYLSR